MASVFKRQADRKRKHGKWIISWFDSERNQWRQCTGSTDKELSLSKGVRLEKESGDRREGLTNNVREESLRPVAEHLEGYLTHVRAKNRDENYVAQLERRIRRVLDAVGAKRLVDVDPGKVERELLTMTCVRGFEDGDRPLSHTTRNEYATSLKGFTTWAFKRRKIDYDPLAGLAKVDEKSVEQVHPRRALEAAEIVRLLDAASRRPEADLLTIRRGPNKGKPQANVRQAVLDRARRTGGHRRMAYLLAIWTGLRRTELAELQWMDVRLDAQVAHLQLRASTTKAGRADVIPLHPQMAEELRSYRPERCDPTQAVLTRVPSINVLKADLTFAGIKYGDREIGYADLHAQRKTLNMLLAGHGVDRRVRQAHLRHTDPRLTEDTYFDTSMFIKPHADELARVPALACGGPQVRGSEDAGVYAKNAAQLMHKTSGPEGQSEARDGTQGLTANDARHLAGDPAQVTQLARDVIKGQGPASCDTGPLSKRVIGVEPTTFTLAT